MVEALRGGESIWKMTLGALKGVESMENDP
jgi:hypothetical protein